MSSILKVRMERLLDERATVTKLHNDLLAHVESREGEQGLTDIESEQIEGYRGRSSQLDEEIDALAEDMKREERSAGASKEIRAHLAGRMDGVSLEGDDVVYHTFAGYARDVILARSSGNIVEQIVGRAGGEKARQDARERLARTPANTLSSNVAGLIPEQHIAQIFQVIDASRPLVASAQRAPLERGQLTYPVVATRPVVAVQSTQKTEAGNQGMSITMATATASTYLGGGDLSWQAIEWSTPNALDLWFRFAAADYALKTEQDAAEVLTDSGFTYNIASPLGATPTYADFLTAVGAGYAEVYANSGRIADTLYMAPDRFGYMLGLTSAAFSQFIDTSQAGIGPLRIVVSRGMEAGEMVVGDSAGLLVAETPGAPVQLRAVEPAIGGLEVGIIGAFEAVVVDPGAFALITTAS
jgi:HK97 family phage major capsid protein